MGAPNRRLRYADLTMWGKLEWHYREYEDELRHYGHGGRPR